MHGGNSQKVVGNSIRWVLNLARLLGIRSQKLAF